MRVYILPYTIKNEVLFNKRASGVDGSMINQFHALREAGHDVGVYVPFGDLQDHLEGVDFFTKLLNTDIKQYVKMNRDRIFGDIIQSIVKFKPDVILSNMYISAKPYDKLLSLNIPIVYYSHAVPGFFSDLNSADLLASFLENGHTLACTSEYHANRTRKYYKAKRKGWTFTNTVAVDHILHPSYIDNQKTAVPGDGIIRHVSAANKEKGTFFILPEFSNSEVFTTISYLGGNMNEYVSSNIEKYKDRIHLDVPHSEMMDIMKNSSAAFVGLASYDTFTITSLEALQYGIPLIVKGFKGEHPAHEMVEPEFRKYIHVYKSTKEIPGIFNEFSKMTLEERQSLADSAYRVMNKKLFTESLENALECAINKYAETNHSNGLESFFN